MIGVLNPNFEDSDAITTSINH